MENDNFLIPYHTFKITRSNPPFFSQTSPGLPGSAPRPLPFPHCALPRHVAADVPPAQRADAGAGANTGMARKDGAEGSNLDQYPMVISSNYHPVILYSIIIQLSSNYHPMYYMKNGILWI